MTRPPPPMHQEELLCLQKFILLLLTEGRGQVAPPSDRNRDRKGSISFLQMEAKRKWNSAVVIAIRLQVRVWGLHVLLVKRAH